MEKAQIIKDYVTAAAFIALSEDSGIDIDDIVTPEIAAKLETYFLRELNGDADSEEAGTILVRESLREAVERLLKEVTQPGEK
ncbi:hypothetical protein BBD42_15445 [Paenibacillus sp. BIHB 4019]|uniref:Uncharacterized protein n=1 Tax=Paenibacillus sp. BIHB 4019 TaxID=1870819 RepID=A0A1B2DJ03_9BACL|nr:hypothetical protein [Paenibacillus sp. BIHB 4019]ANY67704.1 hypothetical protein BBD42_15445 [Paenibacillus sp. BIHB 4019]